MAERCGANSKREKLKRLTQEGQCWPLTIKTWRRQVSFSDWLGGCLLHAIDGNYRCRSDPLVMMSSASLGCFHKKQHHCLPNETRRCLFLPRNTWQHLHPRLSLTPGEYDSNFCIKLPLYWCTRPKIRGFFEIQYRKAVWNAVQKQHKAANAGNATWNSHREYKRKNPRSTAIQWYQRLDSWFTL